MSLKLSTAEKPAQTKSEELLDAYLKGACKYLGNTMRGNVSREAKYFLKNEIEEFKSYYGKPDGEKLLTEIKAEDIAKKEAELKARINDASFKEKANYALNVEPRKERFTSVLELAVTSLPGIALIANAGEQGNLTGAVVGMAAVGAAVGGVVAACKIREGLEAKNQSEQKAIDNYFEAKHSLVALKQLKRAIRKEQDSSYKEEVRQLFAAGYGQPSGGLIQAAKLKNQGR